MKRWKRIPVRDAHGRGRGFTLVDSLSVVAVLATLVALRPHFEDIWRRAQRDSVLSQPEKPNQAPARTIGQDDPDIAAAARRRSHTTREPERPRNRRSLARPVSPDSTDQRDLPPVAPDAPPPPAKSPPLSLSGR